MTEPTTVPDGEIQTIQGWVVDAVLAGTIPRKIGAKINAALSRPTPVPNWRAGFEAGKKAAAQTPVPDAELVETAERAVRIAVWNFLRERGVKQDDCYPIIEGAATSFRAALTPTQDTGQ